MKQLSASAAALQAWVRRYAEVAVEPPTCREVPDRIDAHIVGQMPQLEQDPMLIEELHASTRAQWRVFVANLSDEHTFAMLPQASALARSLARRGLELSVLLKVYRAAHKVLFDYFSELTASVGEDGPPPEELLTFLWSRGEQWLNDSVEALIHTFEDERHHVLAGAAHRRSELVTALLRGSDDDANRVYHDLSHQLRHWQSAAVLWLTDSHNGTSTSSVLSDLAQLVARKVGGPPPLTLVAGSRELWIWVATPGRPDLAPLHDLAETLADAGAWLAVGRPARDIDGFRAGHHEALAVQRMSLTARQPPAVMLYQDVELLCLVSGAPELAHRMVVRELGELASTEGNAALLRETMLVHYEGGLNVETTAKRLFVHKNTVRYRLGRAEELLGHPLQERVAMVELALRHVALFGPPEAPADASCPDTCPSDPTVVTKLVPSMSAWSAHAGTVVG